MRHLPRLRWAWLLPSLAYLALPALAAAQQQAPQPGSKSLPAAILFLLVFVLIALANLAIFRGGRRRWRRSAGRSSGSGFGGFGGGFSGFGGQAPGGRGRSARGFLR